MNATAEALRALLDVAAASLPRAPDQTAALVAAAAGLAGGGMPGGGGPGTADAEHPRACALLGRAALQDGLHGLARAPLLAAARGYAEDGRLHEAARALALVRYGAWLHHAGAPREGPEAPPAEPAHLDAVAPALGPELEAEWPALLFAAALGARVVFQGPAAAVSAALARLALDLGLPVAVADLSALPAPVLLAREAGAPPGREADADAAAWSTALSAGPLAVVLPVDAAPTQWTEALTHPDTLAVVAPPGTEPSAPPLAGREVLWVDLTGAPSAEDASGAPPTPSAPPATPSAPPATPGAAHDPTAGQEHP